MEDSFEIPVTYQGKDYCFQATVARFGYVHRISIEVEGRQIFFEQDDNMQYRGILIEDDIKKPRPDPQLIQAIIEVIESVR